MTDLSNKTRPASIRATILAMWIALAGLLALPAIASLMTDEVNWTMSDFIVAALLLASLGVAGQFVLTTRKEWPYKIAIGLTAGTAFIIIWISLAVGIMGDTANPANLVYIASLTALAIGAAITRLHPDGMMRVLGLVSIMQLAITLSGIALFGADALETLANIVLLALWLVAALFFRISIRKS